MEKIKLDKYNLYFHFYFKIIIYFIYFNFKNFVYTRVYILARDIKNSIRALANISKLNETIKKK